jgi:hypothetical protein
MVITMGLPSLVLAWIKKVVFQDLDLGESGFLQILLELLDGQNGPLICLLLFGGIRCRWIGRAGRGLSKGSSRNS